MAVDPEVEVPPGCVYATARLEGLSPVAGDVLDALVVDRRRPLASGEGLAELPEDSGVPHGARV